MFLYRGSLRLHMASAMETASATSNPMSDGDGLLKEKRVTGESHHSEDVSVVIVKRSRQSKEFRKGNPLVFEGAIKRLIPKSDAEPIRMGEWVRVEVEVQKKNSSSKSRGAPPPRQVLGWGVYNPHSLFRVRIFCHSQVDTELARSVSSLSSAAASIALVLKTKLEAAFTLRKCALGLPSADTNTYRLVNGEGDGLSGMAIDVLKNVVVVMSSAAWCEIYREQVLSVLREVLTENMSTVDPDGFQIVWKTTRSRLQQDGYEEDLIEESTSTAAHTDSNRDVIACESGILYHTKPFQDGQKTGVYCDQRENRLNLAQFTRNKRVLDLCCYHGGFSLNAMINGNSASCVGVDSSVAAIETCISNAELNGLTVMTDNGMGDDIRFIQDDITNFMRRCPDRFDVIVLDPPKLAPTVAGLERATRKYHAFNRDAIKLISDDGGILMTCTCSAAMTQKNGGQYFLKTVHEAAISAGRQVKLLKVNGAAPCHTQSPISFPAGAYLTAALFHVAPKKRPARP